MIKIDFLKSVIFLQILIPFFAAASVMEGQLNLNGKVEHLVNNGKITISGERNCVFMMKWGGNIFSGLESGIEDGFFYTSMGSFLLAIPLDKEVRRWKFNKKSFR